MFVCPECPRCDTTAVLECYLTGTTVLVHDTCENSAPCSCRSFWHVCGTLRVLFRIAFKLVALRKQRLSCPSVCFTLHPTYLYDNGCLKFWCVYTPHLVLLRAPHQLVALRKQHLCCWSICFILYPTYMYLCVNGYLELWCVYTPPLVLLRTACKLVVLRKQPSICFTLYPPTYARMVPPIHAYCSHFPKVRWDSILEGYTRDFM